MGCNRTEESSRGFPTPQGPRSYHVPRALPVTLRLHGPSDEGTPVKVCHQSVTLGVEFGPELDEVTATVSAAVTSHVHGLFGEVGVTGPRRSSGIATQLLPLLLLVVISHFVSQDFMNHSRSLL